MAIQLPNYQITQLPNSSAPPRPGSPASSMLAGWGGRLRGEIPQYYTALLARYGPQNWGPARSRCEFIMGFYPTKNTNGSNVKKPMAILRAPRLLRFAMAFST